MIIYRCYQVYVWIALKIADMRVYVFLCESHALFTEPASTDFNKFFFKIGSYSTIHTFKNYFTTIFLIFNNKQYPNRPKKKICPRWSHNNCTGTN